MFPSTYFPTAHFPPAHFLTGAPQLPPPDAPLVVYHLEPWQEVTYLHELVIWRSETDLAADGQATPRTWAQVTAAGTVPCRFETGKSQQGPAASFVFDESDNLFTLDLLHMPDGVDIGVGDVIQQVTGPEVGRFWTVRGNPQVRNWLANKQSVLCSRLSAPPEGVS